MRRAWKSPQPSRRRSRDRPLPRQPDLDVVGLLRGETHVAGAQRHDAVMQVEPPQHLLGAGEHALVLVPALLRVVIETSSTLVNWCWRIMPRVSLPAAPASARKQGVQRGEPQRQRVLGDDRFADEIGQRHFGGGDQPVADAVDARALRSASRLPQRAPRTPACQSRREARRTDRPRTSAAAPCRTSPRRAPGAAASTSV